MIEGMWGLGLARSIGRLVVKPYLLDLESTNGSFINDNKSVSDLLLGTLTGSGFWLMFAVGHDGGHDV